MKIRLAKEAWKDLACDALFVPLSQEVDLKKGLSGQLDRRVKGLLRSLVETRDWIGNCGEVTVIHRPAGLKAARLVLVGTGREQDFDAARLRETTLLACRKSKAHQLNNLAIVLPAGFDPAAAAGAAVEGILLALYHADEYKTAEKADNRVAEISVVALEEWETRAARSAFHKAEVLAQAVNMARTLSNEPGNCLNPPAFAQKTRAMAERAGVEVEVINEKRIGQLGMNLILAVAAGSEQPPRLLVLKHWGATSRRERPAVFVGKGVTFDSGGISLKPAQSMEEMKADKAGACAVVAALGAISRLKVPRNVIGITPLVENLPGGRAQRPGDVVRSMSGKTIEVINTDAEGRLILADALHYALRFDPAYLVDIATLTGACIVALGKLRAGLFSNNEDLFRRFEEAARRSGEKFWRLPLDAEYRKELKSTIADIKNVGSRWGGAITAAKFLEEFAGSRPWCHVDMAGVDFYPEDEPINGPTGFGVRTLVELAAL